MNMDMSSMATVSSTSSNSSATSTSLVGLFLGDPRCNSDACPAFKASHVKSQAEVSYYYQYHYGEWLSYCCIIVLFFYTVAYAHRLLMYSKTRRAGSSTLKVSDKFLAISRYFTYRRIPGAVGAYLGLPSFGILALTLLGLLLVLAFSFAIHPYYRLYRGFGSPPLAVRAGLMAVSLTPWIFALAGKFNLITLVTGITHEKLNVVHRYISYACLILSIIHTVPYLVNDGAGPTLFGLAGLKAHWYAAGSYEFTGTPPFGILVLLAFFSIPYFRHRVYELFKYSHYAAAVTYLGLMFWHCGNEGNSWYYLYATVAVFVLSLAGRLFLKTSSIFGKHWFDTNIATIQGIGLSMVKISIFAPPRTTWSPGQHVFLRFPSIRAFANHPFTIASIPKRNGCEHQEMVFLVRPYKGFTAVLHSISVASPSSELSLSVDVGGPYGGLGRAIERRYDSVILVAGGGGISSVLPWLLHLSEILKSDHCVTREVVLLWAVQHEDALEWIRDQLMRAVEIAPKNSINLKIFVTRSQEVVEPHKAVTEKDLDAEEKVTVSEPWTIEYKRPDMSKVLPSVVTLSRTVVLGCGPEGMKIDISNTIAEGQKRVLAGEIQELALYTETFGW